MRRLVFGLERIGLPCGCKFVYFCTGAFDRGGGTFDVIDFEEG